MRNGYCDASTLWIGRSILGRGDLVGLRQSPFEKMHGEIPSLVDFGPFVCDCYALIPVHGLASLGASHVYEKGVRQDRESTFLSPPTNTFGTSGDVKWHQESLYDPNLTKYDVTARLQRIGRLEDYHFFGGSTHVDEEDGLLYVTKEVYVGKSPEGSVILVSRAPVMKVGLVANRVDETPMYVEDLVRMTRSAIADKSGSFDNESVDPTDNELGEPMDRELGEPTYR